MSDYETICEQYEVIQRLRLERDAALAELRERAEATDPIVRAEQGPLCPVCLRERISDACASCPPWHEDGLCHACPWCYGCAEPTE